MYYVYIYLNPLKPGNYIYNDLTFEYEPFYIGKGKNYRFKKHLQDVLNNVSQVNSLKVSLIKEILNSDKIPIIMKIYDNLSDIDPSIKEKHLINNIGRLVVNDGPLTNITGGGEYDTFKNHPDKDKIFKKMSDIKKGKKLNDETKQKIIKNHQTEEYRNMISEIMKSYFINNSISDQTCKKISEKLLSKKIIRSEETKKKIGDANRYRKHTKQSRKNMSNAHIDIIMPDRYEYKLISPINELYIFYKQKELCDFLKIHNMSIRLIRDNFNNGKIKIRRTSILTKNTENWEIVKKLI